MNKSNSVFIALLFSILFATQLYTQDWSGLSRYRDLNLKTGMPTSKEKRVVFMGNSITESWSEHHPEFFTGKPYINRGIAGQTTQQMLIRFRADVVNLKPRVVVIMAGTNDIAGNTGPSTLEMIEDNIISMIQLAKANNIKVVLCSVLPVKDYPWKTGLEPSEKVIALNEKLRNAAEKLKITYVDIFSAMVNDEKGMKAEYSEDGVHPNITGYKVMEPLVETAIAKALNR